MVPSILRYVSRTGCICIIHSLFGELVPNQAGSSASPRASGLSGLSPVARAPVPYEFSSQRYLSPVT